MVGCLLFVSVLLLLLPTHLMAAHALLQRHTENPLQTPDVAVTDTGPPFKGVQAATECQRAINPIVRADPGPHLDVKTPLRLLAAPCQPVSC